MPRPPLPVLPRPTIPNRIGPPGPCPPASPRCCIPFGSCSASAAISPRPRHTAPPAQTSTPSQPASAPDDLAGDPRASATRPPACRRAGAHVARARGAGPGYPVCRHPRERAITTPPAPTDPVSEQPGDPPAGQPADLPAAGQQAAGQQAAGQPADAQVARPATERPSRRPGWNDPELFLPTPEEFDAQVRRRPLGRTLVEICLDLAVSTRLLHRSILEHAVRQHPFARRQHRRFDAREGQQAGGILPGARPKAGQQLGPGCRWDAMRSAASWVASSANRRMVRSTRCQDRLPRPRRWPPARPDRSARTEVGVTVSRSWR